jgi:hypothetical protein
MMSMCDGCGLGMRAVGDDYICENADCPTNSIYTDIDKEIWLENGGLNGN